MAGMRQILARIAVLTVILGSGGCSIFRLGHINPADPLYIGSGSNTTAPLADPWIAYYRFNNDFCDSTGNTSHDGLLSYGTMTFTNDRFGNKESACYFNGAGDIYFTNLKPVNTNIFSWTFWIYDLSTDTIFRIWMTSSESPSAVAGQIFLREVDELSGGYVQLFMGSTNAIFTSAGSQFWKDGNWHMIALVSDGSNTTFYYDMNPIISVARCESPPGIYFLGGHIQPGTEMFYGFIDDLRLFDIAITPSDISNYYHENGW